MTHIPWRQELPLLDIDRLAGARGGNEKIGLTAEKGGDLQDVHHLCGRGALVGLMHVGDDGKAERLLNLGEDRQRCLEADAAGARGARPVRLVEG
jgi:hypothetical protein